MTAASASSCPNSVCRTTVSTLYWFSTCTLTYPSVTFQCLRAEIHGSIVWATHEQARNTHVGQVRGRVWARENCMHIYCIKPGLMRLQISKSITHNVCFYLVHYNKKLGVFFVRWHLWDSVHITRWIEISVEIIDSQIRNRETKREREREGASKRERERGREGGEERQRERERESARARASDNAR